MNSEADERSEDEKLLTEGAVTTDEVAVGESPQPVRQFEILLSEEKRKSEEYLKRLQYLQADSENFRRRTERQLSEMQEVSTARLVKKLLPVLDDLEMAVQATESGEEKKVLMEGVGMVAKKLKAVLEAEGLERIQAVGKPFDPDLHEAVEKVEGNGEVDTVLEEIRSGYTFKGKVIRHSLVKVAVTAKQNAVHSGGDSV
jgi:molecular chaperone GrpE